MKRSQLRNVFPEKRTLKSQVAYIKQRNYCTRLLRKEKWNYFENIDTSKIFDNKMLWKTAKPTFSNKCVNREIITSVKDYKIFSENLEVVKTFNVFSLNTVKVMNIFRPGTFDWSGSYWGSSFKNYREIQKTP